MSNGISTYYTDLRVIYKMDKSKKLLYNKYINVRYTTYPFL